MTTPQEKDIQVIDVLHESTEPLGPTEIARRINQPWCPQSPAIMPVLRRIGAVRHQGGRYTKPEAK